MNDQPLFHQVRLPARLTTQQTAALLGFQEHDIPVLIRKNLLKPLGNPAASAPKYFSTVEIEQLTRDPKWPDRATKAVTQHWQHKNRNRQLRNGKFG